MPEEGTAAVEPQAPPAETGVADQEKPGEAKPESAPAKTQDGEPRGDAEGKGTRRFERRIARLQREAAEARAEAKAAREQVDRLLAPRFEGEDQPKRGDYADDAEFNRALVRWEFKQEREQERTRRSEEDAEREIERETAEAQKAFAKQRKEAAKRHDDFDDVLEDLLSDQAIANHPGIGGVIWHSDIGAEIAYYLGKNPDEAEEIAEMHPYAAAARLGEIQTRLRAEMAKPKGKPASGAPEPITPIAGGVGNPETEPSENDSTADWIKKRNAQIRARRKR